jgi:hypothetical protein
MAFRSARLARPAPLPPFPPGSRGEDILAQRYISTRPLFTSPRELQFVQQRQQLQAAAAAREGEEGGEPADAAVLSALGGFYRAILAAMRDEAVVVEQVGGSAPTPLTPPAVRPCSLGAPALPGGRPRWPPGGADTPFTLLPAGVPLPRPRPVPLCAARV